MQTVNVISPRSPVLLLLAIGSLVSPAVGIAASQLDSLLSNSPFGAAPKSGQPIEAGNQLLELRSIWEDKGQPLFSIYDTATKRSRWVGLNDANGDVVIKSYDAEAHTISLEQNGRPLSLTLKSGPRIVPNSPMPVQAVMPYGAAGLSGQQFLPNGVGKSPEAHHMQQIADEIRRRRALRQQAPNMPTPTPGATGNSGPMRLPGASGSSGPMPMPTPGTGTGPMPIPRPGASTGPTPNTPSRQ